MRTCCDVILKPSHNVIFEMQPIKPNGCYAISAFSANPDEDEVLLDRATAFRVTSVRDLVDSDHLIIKMGIRTSTENNRISPICAPPISLKKTKKSQPNKPIINSSESPLNVKMRERAFFLASLEISKNRGFTGLDRSKGMGRDTCQ